MKTGKELFEQMPANLQKLYLIEIHNGKTVRQSNLTKEEFIDYLFAYKFLNFYHLLMSSFVFSESLMGVNFWLNCSTNDISKDVLDGVENCNKVVSNLLDELNLKVQK